MLQKFKEIIKVTEIKEVRNDYLHILKRKKNIGRMKEKQYMLHVRAKVIDKFY